MVRYALVGLAAAVLVGASLVPDDTFARRGGGGGFRAHSRSLRSGGQSPAQKG
jgi:hypothetical protein